MAERSSRSPGQSRLDNEQREKLVKDYYTENNLEYFVDCDVFNACFHIIGDWLDNGVLVPYMMKYGLIKRPADSEMLTSPYYLPDQRRTALLTIAGRGGDNGYFLLYMCIRESCDDNPFGHGDAVKELEDCAAHRRVKPTWERPQRDYREPSSQQESGQDTTSTADLGTDHGGQPSPAAAVQDVVESSVAKVQAHNLHQAKGKQHEYVKPPYSSSVRAGQTTASPASIIREEPNTHQRGGLLTQQQPLQTGMSNIPVVTPVQETHISLPENTAASASNHGNRFERRAYSGDDVERDKSASVAAKGGQQYHQQRVEEEARRSHADLVETVKRGNFGVLQTDASRNSLFVSSEDCSDEESVKRRVAKLVSACLNSRASNRTGVIIVGVHPDDYHVRMSHVPHWQAIEQTIRDCVVHQLEETDPSANLSAPELSMIKISPVQYQANQVVLITVHPDWNLCHQTSVYRCLFRDKNGKLNRKLEPVCRVVRDELETTFTDVSFKKVKDLLVKALSSQTRK